MQRLLVSTLIALIVMALIAGAAERHWRARGYVPGIIDSQDLWAQQRQRAIAGGGKTKVALLGASRTVYSVDLDRFRQRLPNYEPVMLALDATPAMATLRDLARDERFNGVVICDIDGIGLWNITWDYQQPWVDHYHRQWTISHDLHRSMLTLWQQHAVIARQDFSLLRTLVRWVNNEPEPFHPYMRLSADRSGAIDYKATDTSVHRRELEAHLAKYGGKLPGPDPAEWLANLAQVRSWVQAIQQRGGKVIFYATPISGLRRQVEEDTYPRAQFWDRVADATGAATLHADDVAPLRDFPLPDESHVDYRDKQRYTDALIDALIGRRLL
jgi:hypothetical protein